MTAKARRGPSLHDRINRISPQGLRVIHHHLDHQRHELPHQVHAVPQLLAIDRPVPGGPAVNQLVAQRVDARQHDRQHRHRVLPAQAPRAPPCWRPRSSLSMPAPAATRSGTSRNPRTRTGCRAAPGCFSETRSRPARRSAFSLRRAESACRGTRETSAAPNRDTSRRSPSRTPR